jgi:hypothetical protein
VGLTEQISEIFYKHETESKEYVYIFEPLDCGAFATFTATSKGNTNDNSNTNNHTNHRPNHAS